MEELNSETVSELLKVGRIGMGPQAVPGGNIPYVLVPDGCKAVPMPELIFNEHTAKPERVKQNVGVLDPESFAQYYTLFSDENSRVFADEQGLKVLAVLDYHGALEGAPRWGQHRLTLTLRQSEEWKAWIAKNNQHFTQVQFAEFLEQNAVDITKPSPGSMRDVASDLQATTEVDFGSSQRMLDGQVKFKYTETTKTTVAGSEIKVPEQFVITIPAFVGGERVDMRALLRFRIKEAKLVFWYTLIRPEEVIRTTFAKSRNEIATKLSIAIINGTPA